jgi:hypothetical protein
MSTRKSYMKLAHLVPDVVRMRAEGETLQSIGHHLGLSKQRISQVIQAAKRQEGILHQWGWPFSVRTFNIIERLAIKSKEDAMDLYRSGHLHPQAVSGFGLKSYAEICEWLEVPMLEKPPFLTKHCCPHCGKRF